MELTRYGLWIGRSLGRASHPEAARLAEELGFGALWLGGSPRLARLRPMLEATERIVIASGVVNIWAYEPDDLAREFAELDADFPGRVLLGLGIGHPEATALYERPLRKTRSFLDGIAASRQPVPRQRMILAALGPKMLDLSVERTLGTHPYFTPAAHTRFARERLGPGALVAPEQAVVVDHGDRAAAHEVARRYAEYYLGLTNYATNLRRFGYTEGAINDAAPELIDELVPQGPADQLVGPIRAHLDAGADHVCVQALQAAGSEGVPAEDWRALAAVLLG